MRRAWVALGTLGLLDLVLLLALTRLDGRAEGHLPRVWVLGTLLACIVLTRGMSSAVPAPRLPRSSVDASGLVLLVGAVLLPGPYLVALAGGLWLANHALMPWFRCLGNVLLELAAVLLAAISFHAVMSVGSGNAPGLLAAACLVAGLVLCVVSAVLVSLLVRFVDGVPFHTQPIWQPEHYARAQAFDLLGSLTAFLLLMSPWSLLFVGAPQLLMVALLLRDAGSRAAADQDAKTGLLNHPTFVARARTELGRAARSGEPVSLLVLDLDHLREVNNVHGHPVGDLAIAAVADVLRQSVRAHDLAARVGGEEFLVLLPDTDLAGAMEVAERVRGTLARRPVPGRAEPLAVTVSVGVAATEPGEPWESLYDRGDQALLVAKRAGRDRVQAALALR